MIGVNVGVVTPLAFLPSGGTRGSFYDDLTAQGRDHRDVVSRWS